MDEKDLAAQMAEDAAGGNLPSNQETAQVAELARRQLALERELEELAAATKAKQQELEEVRDRRLPDLLLQLGVRELKLATGEKVTIQRLVFASIAKKHEEGAFKWLRENGYKGLIKLELSGRVDEADVAGEVARLAKKLGVELEQKASVHPSTLKAFAAEQLRERVDFPRDLFGIYEVNRAKLS